MLFFLNLSLRSQKEKKYFEQNIMWKNNQYIKICGVQLKHNFEEIYSTKCL